VTEENGGATSESRIIWQNTIKRLAIVVVTLPEGTNNSHRFPWVSKIGEIPEVIQISDIYWYNCGK